MVSIKRKATPSSVDVRLSISPGVVGLPLTDGSVALTVDHVVNIDAGEENGHARYHFLSSFVWTQYTT